MYTTESSRWLAIQSRDQAAASSFVYAVISTKIYCRPACPSRLARRANVRFYNTADDAARAGYRPCLRCKPEQTSFNLDSQQAQRDIVRRACRYIEDRNGDIKFPEVAKVVGLSTRYLYGVFKAVMGTTPAKYAASLKSGLDVQTVSVAPSMASGAISPVDGFLYNPVFDGVSLDALPILDYSEAAMIRADSTSTLPYDSMIGGDLLEFGYNEEQQLNILLATDFVDF